MKLDVKYIIGIDEAGRGPLAGPVAVGVMKFPSNLDKEIVKELKKIKGKDSKKLKESEREVWFLKILTWKKEGKLDFHATLVSASIIDTKGISYAIKQGMKICLRKVKADCNNCHVKLDGSLYAPAEFISQQTIIKGDEKESVISLASICAKVTRDRFMIKLSKKFPSYNFEIHKGYGTLKHRTSIKQHGASPYHRKSFLRNIL